MKVVLDSWPVLRYLERGEPSTSALRALLAEQRPIMSWINLGEVFYVLRRLTSEQDAHETVRDLQEVLDTELPTAQRVIEAARIKATHHVSYADAFAAATAIAHNATLWTGDPELLTPNAPWQHHDLRQWTRAARRR